MDAIVLWAEGMKADASAAVIDEAHKRKLKVFADAPNLAEAKDVVKAGVDTLISSIRDREVDDELISLLKEKKIALAPALTALEARFIYAEKSPMARRAGHARSVSVRAFRVSRDPVVMNKFKRNPKLATYRQEFAPHRQISRSLRMAASRSHLEAAADSQTLSRATSNTANSN